jgi:transposase
MIGKPSCPVRREAARKRTKPSGWHLAARPTHPGWLGRFRRLSKDYEYLPVTSEATIYLAMIQILIRRLAAQ